MTDKVQKIREEVKKLHGNPYYMMAVKDALAIIDSLQEEPVIKDAPSEDYVKGFSDGRLYQQRQKPVTSVWHDASELPDCSEAIVIEHSEYGTSIVTACRMSRVKGAKWALIEDILKL